MPTRGRPEGAPVHDRRGRCLIGCNHIAGNARQYVRVLARVASLLALCALPWLPLRALADDGRHYMVSGWTMDEGLPHNLVHAIAQDREGFIWVGSWEGVVRFNGRHFTVFDRQNTPGAELSGVFCILPEADGGVLFGTTANGVFRYHKGRWSALGRDEEARHMQASALLRDRDGMLWIASVNRLLRMDAEGRLHDAGAVAGLPGTRIIALAQDDDGALLVGTETAGAFRLRDGQALPWGGDWLGMPAVRGFARDGEGGWLVAGDGGVRWRHADGRVEQLVPGQRADAVLRDRVGAVWINLASGSLIRHVGGSDERQPVPGTVGVALFEDREGLVWVGSTDGLYRMSEVAAVGYTRDNGLESNYVRVVMQTEDQVLWIGQAAGLSRGIHGRVGKVRLTHDGGHDPSVLALAQQRGVVWAGTYDRGVFKLDSQGEVLGRISLDAHSEPMVRALLPDEDGGLWIGGNHGLSHYREGQLRTVLDGRNDPGMVVQVLYRDAAGTLWVGATGGMLAVAKDGSLRRWKGGRDLPAQYVFDFLQDPSGELWIASDRGLLRMRGNDFRVYDHTLGLPRDKLFRIIDDLRGNLWLSSNQGVFRIAREDFDLVDAGKRKQLAVHMIDRSDGMPGDQCNGASMPAGWRASNGALIFPTSAGVALIDPKIAGLHDGKVSPVVFESMTVDGVELPPQHGHRLEPGTRRLSVGYAALNFRSPNKLRYRYRLYGFDANWVEAGSGTEAVYTNLPPGSYRLEVQAMTLPLDWARQQEVSSAVMTLEVVPPLWKRTSVRVLAGLLLAGLVLLGFWLRTASYRRSQRRLSREITVRTEELREKNRALEVAHRERGSLMQRLEHQATHDELTSLPNRRAADRRLQLAVARARAAGAPLCVALADVDHFKYINDNHGHEVGDHVLQRIAAVLRGEDEGADANAVFAARHGGEEFLLVLEGMDREAALDCLHDLHARIAALPIVTPDGDPLAVTISIGAVHLESPRDDARTLLVAADRKLYRAKHEGRNRVVD